MPIARMIREKVTCLVTRRTSQRLFRFLPGDEVVEQIFLFCLAYAASKTGVLVHGWILMSNHYHVVITDVEGRAPEFFQLLNQNISNLLKRHLGLPEEIWNTSQTSLVDLSNELCPSDNTVVQKLVYTIGNAKTSGLVRKWHWWEGSMSKPEDMGQRVVRVKRPDCASSRTSLPANAELEVTVPPSLEDWDRADLMRILNEELRAIAAPKKPIGMKRIKEQSIWDRPKTPPKKSERNPHVAGDAERRVAMIALLRAFRDAYKCALEKYCQGEECAFPEGTWKMTRVFGAKLEGQSDPPLLAA